MMRLPEFKTRASLTKSLLYLVKLMAGAAKNIRGKAGVANRQPPDQVS